MTVKYIFATPDTPKISMTEGVTTGAEGIDAVFGTANVGIIIGSGVEADGLGNMVIRNTLLRLADEFTALDT